jgi:hypothetical protein
MTGFIGVMMPALADSDKRGYFSSTLYRLRLLGHRIEPYAAMAGV